MKTLAKTPLILGCLGLAISASLVSCVDPYYGGATSASVTTYRTGYEVQTLPSGYRTEVISGDPYYVYNGTYFRPRSGRYVVVEAPRQRGYYDSRYDRRDGPYDRTVTRERVITHLPSGYRVVTHRGTRYYQVRDTYYQQRGSGYVIVQSPY
jgi:hypothetical protein